MIGTIVGWLLGLLAVVLVTPVAARRALDRTYYRGPPNDHFDGRRFFNPSSAARDSRRRSGLIFLWRALTQRRARPWPQHVPPAAVPPRQEAAAVGQGDHPLTVTWIGHSTVLVETAGLAILTDPIWSERAGPWNRLGPRRVREPGLRLEELPPIDLVLLSHNHYDHLDLPTLGRLWARDRPLIVTPLGNDTILRARGIEAWAADWGERVAVRPGIDVIVERVHHWSSRWGSDRNRALWSGFTVTLPGGNLFFAGDTAWGDGGWIAGAVERGPIRLAIIPIGAYRPADLMRASHVDPDEAVAIFERLGAAHALAVHWGTFRLSEEAIDDPPTRLREALAARRLAPDRFRAAEAGEPWEVP